MRSSGDLRGQRRGRLGAVGLVALGAMLLTAGCAPSSGTNQTITGGDSGGGDNGLFSTGPGGEEMPSPGGDIVARIELPAPPTSLDKFVVRATLPVPKGTFPRADGKFPFAVRNVSGLTAPTQVEIVSRYPLDSDGADVVEVLAYVDRPAGAAGGAPIGYDVVEHPHAPRSMPIRKSVMTAIAAPGTIKITAEDCFGHSYKVDPLVGMRSLSGNVDVLRRGQAAVQLRNYGTMVPTTQQIGGSNGALSHLFGVHTYMTSLAHEEFMLLDLRFNNGPSGSDKSPSATQDDPLGDVYFKRIAIEIPQGWQVLFDVNDPAVGAPVGAGGRVSYDIVKPNADGTLHFMPSQGMFHRRLAVVRNSAVARARAYLDQTNLAFCVDGDSPDTGLAMYSWWNPATARYYPQKFPLPKLAQIGLNPAGELWNRYTTTLGHLTSGTSGSHPYDAPQLGWAHPWSVAYGGMTGGTEIWFFDGFKVAESRSQYGYRALEMKHRMYSSRMPQVLYDKDGEHTTIERWLVQGASGPFAPMNYFQGLVGNSNDPFGLTQSPAFQRNYVAAQNLAPAYEATLRSYMPIDFQHYTRYLQSPMALSWLGNDAIAKDDLRMCAEIFRLSYHEYPISSSGYVSGTTMLADINAATNNPGYGIGFGRGESWGLVSAIAAFGLSDPAWRSRWDNWFSKASDLLANGQSNCNGIIQRILSNKILGGAYQARQSIEQAITENMLWSLKESVFRDRNPMRFAQTEATLTDSVYAMIGPLAWRPGWGPASHLAVAPVNGTMTPFCNSLPASDATWGADTYQTPCSFAWGYAMTGDPTFLSKALEMYSQPTLPAAMGAQGLTNCEVRAALIAVTQ